MTATDIDSTATDRPISEDGESLGDLVYLIDNGRTLYEITDGNDELIFQITTEGGTIFLSPGAIFSIDIQEEYNITVTAMDGPGRNSSVIVLISILDSNDNPPEILAPRGLNLTLSEISPLGVVILESINATDNDRGLNGEIKFLIIAGDETDSFSIEPDTGRITLSGSLDREGGTGEIVNLTIAAQDRGVPPLQDTIQVTIFIEDINDFPPSFAQEEFFASVREGGRSGLSVLQAVASDGDEGVSGVISYTILEGANGKFTIDPQTGEIYTSGDLDREEISEYRMTVLAVDNPMNVSLQLSSVVNVTVAIEDLNDNAPVFNQSNYEIEILDSLTMGADVVRITASDSDEGVNAEIRYEFVDPLPDNANRFRIVSQTGLVKIVYRPRHDIQSSYTFIIRALDNGTPNLQSDTTLTIIIHDVNETPPIFEEDSYNVTLNETVAIRTPILQVRATDPDPGLIGEVRYRITAVFDAAGAFGVNETSGVIFVASRLDFDVRYEYTLRQGFI